MIEPAARRPCAAQRAPLDALSDLYRGELVGLRASVVRSCNRGIVGASGMVVEETKNMLVLSPRPPLRGAARPRIGGGAGIEDHFMESSGGRLRGTGRPYRAYPKAGSVWRFEAAPGRNAARDGAEIDGSLIARRPEDRLRAKLPQGAAPGLRAGGGGAGA